MFCKDYLALIPKLVEFLRDEVTKRGFSSVVLGLSGGIDSAVVALLCKKAFPNSTHTLLMPSFSSSKSSVKDAEELCKEFRIPYDIVFLEDMQKSFMNALQIPHSSLMRIGNLSARLRMVCLYDYSFANSALVIGTSNKSELKLGYGTIYGDLASAINPIGDFYKSEIYSLAKYLEVPQSIMQKAPSADLYEGQSDEKELGYSYEELDKVMFLLEKDLQEEAILKEDCSKEVLEFVKTRMQKMHFKQEMPLIARF
ncbi:NAD+ synthase [Helicobacter burdigaliensis]|uniref:NAD+ synthase n=1 Tax=Helicobacter burdigaliensis TaxID=2315334 RepID=UPI000EF6CBF2|nr:NAD+ synthase [Helicobacter burdigaliensis]